MSSALLIGITLTLTLLGKRNKIKLFYATKVAVFFSTNPGIKHINIKELVIFFKYGISFDNKFDVIGIMIEIH